MTKVCCPTTLKPVSSNYERKGVTSYIVGLDSETSLSRERAILFIPDIFSFHPNAHQVADALAAQGFTVMLPNFFGESPGWTPGKEIDPKSHEWGEFYSKHVSQFDRHLSTVESSVKFLKALGAKSIGALGLCFGSKVAALAVEKWPSMFDSVVLPHPAFLTEVDGKGFSMPTFLMYSDDEDQTAMEAVGLNLRLGNAASVHKHMVGLHHGFMGARGYLPGSLSEMPEEYVKASEDALNEMIAFFVNNLPSKPVAA